MQATTQLTSFINKYFIKEIVVFSIFLAAYAPTLVWMWDRWFAADSYYSHGILIPFVSGFLTWQMRSELKTIKRTESSWGLGLIILGLAMYLVSTILRIYFSSGVSMLVVFYGIVLHFWGAAIFKKLLFPLFFLTFMVPIPMAAITTISFRLKLFAAEFSTDLLNELRVPAIREGSIIKMRTAYVVVDDVCSGLRSLISLAALGSIFAFWMKAALWKKVLLFLSTIPIAVITNVFRVLFLALVSEIYGSQYIAGFLHDLSGFMVFVLAFILLHAMGKILE